MAEGPAVHRQAVGGKNFPGGSTDVSLRAVTTRRAFRGHTGEGKPFGNNYLPDQYLDDTRYDKDKAPEAGRKSDPKTGGGYNDNLI